MKGNIIVLEDGKFKVIYNEEDRLPDNFTMRHAIRNDWNGETYQVPGRDIKFRWSNGTYQGNSFLVRYQGETIETYNSPNITNACQAMNYYCNLSTEELENLKIESQNTNKSELEDLIEKLKEELKELENKKKSFERIENKISFLGKEINQLINDN